MADPSITDFSNKTFHYKVTATNDENVGVIEANSKEDAMSKLTDIYLPHPGTLEVEIIDKKTHDKEKVRIAKERKRLASQ